MAAKKKPKIKPASKPKPPTNKEWTKSGSVCPPGKKQGPIIAQCRV